ncbi:hypothetical protein F3Y22_tig00112281pilonHSYRG00061 [Hibiscus syriacus]|uniref:RNase H type-1 domain-containing protein n=1 Tax=Hibiscus syriacus TaxID=106335 RepID=A0A6A2X2Q6_HIBSY|nr:hypothetical protein F3Y22_tig00112281pilonHSYRG00061 [Hibiscus syriacus]
MALATLRSPLMMESFSPPFSFRGCWSPLVLAFYSLVEALIGPVLRMRLEEAHGRGGGWPYGSIRGGRSARRGSIGGVIRNSNGEWIIGFTKNIGTTLILHAELWSIYEGLLIARSLGILRLWIQSDCSRAVKLVEDGRSIDSHILLLRIIMKLRQYGTWTTKIQWINRNENKIADKMAKLASWQHFSMVHFDSPQMSLQIS